MCLKLKMFRKLFIFICVSTACRVVFCVESRTNSDFYTKLCYVLKLQRFCLPFGVGSLAFPYQYPFPIPPIIQPVPIGVNPGIGVNVNPNIPFPMTGGAGLNPQGNAPLPMIVNPTQQSFTIPTMLTIPFNRPTITSNIAGQQPQTQQLFPNLPICPPTIIICPPNAALAPVIPNIDPRQGRILNVLMSVMMI